jgi:hypothetical protein
MFAAIIKLSRRSDRAANPHAILVPGGQAGVWICGVLGFFVVLIAIIFSIIPPGDTTSKAFFEFKVLAATIVFIVIGLALYWRGVRQKSATA